MNAERVKRALSMIHAWEREQGRVGAIEYGLRTSSFGLTHAEFDVLLSALHVNRNELRYQWEAP